MSFHSLRRRDVGNDGKIYYLCKDFRRGRKSSPRFIMIRTRAGSGSASRFPDAGRKPSAQGREAAKPYRTVNMDTTALKEFIGRQLEGTDYFLVDLTVSKENEIKVEIDSMRSVDIDFCVRLTREIEEAFPRDDEDYELEVGSAGLTSPFKVKAQFEKNLGNRVEVLTRDGRKLQGELSEVAPESFTILVPVKVRKEGEKRPVVVLQPETFAYDAVKSVKYHFEF